MRFLSCLSLVLLWYSVPPPSLSGTVFLDQQGVYQLAEKPQQGWSSPIRGYVFGQPLFFSCVTQEALEDIPSIGPSLASKIMHLKAQNLHPSWDDVDAIPGIGKAKLKILQQHLDLSQ